MEAHLGDAQNSQQAIKIRAKVTRFQRLRTAGDHIVAGLRGFLGGTQQFLDFPREGNVPHGGGGFGHANLHPVGPDISVPDPDVLHRAADMDQTGAKVDIAPLQAAHLANAEAAVQTNQKPHVPGRGVRFQEPLQQRTVVFREHLQGPAPFAGDREADREVGEGPLAAPRPEPENHLEHPQGVADGLDAETLFQLRVHIGLDVLFAQVRGRNGPEVGG